MAEMEKMNDLDLMNVAGGVGTAGELKWKWVMSDPGEGYLALRSDPSVSADNEWISVLVDEEKAKIMDVLGKLQHSFNIRDMQLEEISTEDVIKKIYEEGVQ